MLLSFNPTPTDAAQLVADFSYVNANPGTYTITLQSSTTYTLSNSTGKLPTLGAGVNLTIDGNGDTIERKNSGSAFRLFDVSSDASLTLNNLTLTGGLATGTGTGAEGGAIYSSGTLTLNSVDVKVNKALGGNGATVTGSNSNGTGATASGGGLYVAGGNVTISKTTFSNNTADGGKGGNYYGHTIWIKPGVGGAGNGGAMYVANGTVTLKNDTTLSQNHATGGKGGSQIDRTVGTGGIAQVSGNGFGAGLYVAGGSVTLTKDQLLSNVASGYNASGGGLYAGGGTVALTDDTVEYNHAQGGNGVAYINSGSGGNAYGGGVYVTNAAVTLTADTLHQNNAKGGSGITGQGAGQGGNAYGGSVFENSGTVTANTSTFSNNEATGGLGGTATNRAAGGTGGAGGNSYGGGLFVQGGQVTLTSDTVFGNTARGVKGGNGAVAYVGYPSSYNGGTGGNGGSGSGGGLYMASGTATLESDIVKSNHADGGNGGAGGNASNGGAGGHGGNGGNAYGGGLLVTGGTITIPPGDSTTVNSNAVAAGKGGTGGTGSTAGIAGSRGTAAGPNVWQTGGTINGFLVYSSFAGLNNTDNNTETAPPDTDGAAGPLSYLETVNSEVALYNKSTGATIASDSLSDFFFTVGGLTQIANAGLGDAVGTYDPLAKRFIVGDLYTDQNGNNAFLLAVSKSDNPTTFTTKDWYFYEINNSETNIFLQDYPGNIGYNAGALVITQNSFEYAYNPQGQIIGEYVAHALVNAFKISALTSGAALTEGTNYFLTDVYSTDANAAQSLRPAVMQDSTNANDPMWFVEETNPGMPGSYTYNDSITVVKETNVLSNNPTFTTTNLSVNPYYTAVAVLQPGGLLTADTDSRIMKVAMQNGLLVAAHQVSDSASDLDEIQWYEINTSSGTPTLQQQGDVSGGSGTYYAYPGIDINSRGDIGMSYSASGTGAGQYLSVYVTGRTPTDPNNTMETPVLIQAGQANDIYDGREGDFSGINVDSDGSFWISNEYAAANGSWGTAIADFTVGNVATGTLTPSILTADTVSSASNQTGTVADGSATYSSPPDLLGDSMLLGLSIVNLDRTANTQQTVNNNATLTGGNSSYLAAKFSSSMIEDPNRTNHEGATAESLDYSDFSY